MKWRAALKYALLGFVALSVAAIALKDLKPGPRPGKAAAEMPAEQPRAAQVPLPAAKASSSPGGAVVYYFYTNTRCSSCKTIEAYTREAVSSMLAAGGKGPSVEFKGVNLEEKENEHFISDYRLQSKAVVVQKFSGGKPLAWERLDKVWTLLGDKKAFMDYVAGETSRLLEDNER